MIDLTFAACPVKLTIEKDTESQNWLICARLTLGGPKRALQQYQTKEKAIYRAATLCKRIPALYVTECPEIEAAL